MTIPRDTALHLAAGLIVVAGVLALQWLATIDLGLAVAAAGIAVGWGYERLQEFRGEGTPEARDAIATALPGCIAGLAIHLTGWQPW